MRKHLSSKGGKAHRCILCSPFKSKNSEYLILLVPSVRYVPCGEIGSCKVSHLKRREISNIHHTLNVMDKMEKKLRKFHYMICKSFICIMQKIHFDQYKCWKNFLCSLEYTVVVGEHCHAGESRRFILNAVTDGRWCHGTWVHSSCTFHASVVQCFTAKYHEH